MLIKVHELEYSWEYDAESRRNIPSIIASTEVWINPDRVTFVYPRMKLYPEQGLIKCGRDHYNVTTEDAQRIIDHINGAWPEAGEADTPSTTEQAVYEISLQEIEDMHKHFSKPDGE